ncbi:MAG: hypothetical protein HY447_04800 [Candidatus Omnitrophica bacterium]|nr:hypothetical protein [Candidatus Omnitrophota bacterium]
MAEYDPAYDLDGDGQISISEATLYSSVAAILVDGFSRAMQAFEVMDANHDYVLTLEEAFPVISRVFKMAARVLDYDPTYDLNDDGVISVDEAVFFGHVAHTVFDETENLYLSLLWPYQDETPTAREFIPLLADIADSIGTHTGEEGFNPHFDVDQDGEITQADFEQFLNAIHAVLSNRYDDVLRAFFVVDTNHDFDISPEEAVIAFYRVRLMASRLIEQDLAYDVSQNGSVDIFDLFAFNGVRMLLDHAEGGRYIQMLRSLLALDTNQDGGLTVLEVIPVLAAVHAAIGIQRGEEGYNSAYDIDHDGVIEEEDFQAFVNTAHTFIGFEQGSAMFRAFELMDTNHDYVLTAEEAALGLLTPFWIWRGEREPDPIYDVNDDGVFNGTDLNYFLAVVRSHSTDPEQAFQYFAALNVLDRDRDGVLTAQEAVVAFRELLATMFKSEGDEGYNADFDFNEDRSVNQFDLAIMRGTIDTFMSEEQKVILRAFEAMDTNHDYVLTSQEASLTIQAVRRIILRRLPYDARYDVDGDGQITRNDLEIFRNVAGTFIA